MNIRLPGRINQSAPKRRFPKSALGFLVFAGLAAMSLVGCKGYLSAILGINWVTGVSLNLTSVTEGMGQSFHLDATVTPTNATTKMVQWSSSNPSVAKVDSSGLVKTLGVGTATITVKTVDGGKTATCSVTVDSFGISGTIVDSGGSPVSGVTVSVTLTAGGTATATTDASGTYSLSLPAAGSYTAVPSKASYSFNPSSKSVSITSTNPSASNIDFTGSLIPYSISGTVTAYGSGLSGVTISVSSVTSTAGTATTDASGNYTIAVPAAASYTVTPTLSGATFTPAARSVAVSDSSPNATGVDFARSNVATPLMTPSGKPTYTSSSDMTITLTDPTPGATIYYTVTNGTTGTAPSTSSTVYSGTPISVAGDGTVVTIEAIAAKSGLTVSGSVTGTYTIDYPVESAPTMNPPPGTYFTSQDVSLSDSGAAIYYTTDGTTPTSSSTVYAGSPIATGGAGTTTTIEAMATKSGMKPSSVTTGTYSTVQTAQWATSDCSSSGTTCDTTTSSTNVGGEYLSTAVDQSGDIVAVGRLEFYTTNTVSFGNGITLKTTGTGNSEVTALAVGYNSSGAAQWATKATGPSEFDGVVADSSGNFYAVGAIESEGAFNFGGNSQAVTCAANTCGVLVKYDSLGQAQWAVTTGSGSGESWFNSVSVDTNGNIYVSGYISGATTVDFGNGESAAGADGSSDNAVVVKYNSSGQAQWAQTPVTAASGSVFYGAVADSTGNVYAVGDLYTSGSYGFGNSVAVTPSASNDGVIVKYNSSGSAVRANASSVSLYSIALDASGDIYAAGGALLKMSSSGALLWNDVITGSGSAGFGSLAVDSSGNVYAGFGLSSTGVFAFGNNVYCAGGYSGSDGNSGVVKFSSSGAAQWAQSVATAPNQSYFSGVAVDTSGDLYAAGAIFSSATFDFGNSVTPVPAGTNTSGWNVILLKYLTQ